MGIIKIKIILLLVMVPIILISTKSSAYSPDAYSPDNFTSNVTDSTQDFTSNYIGTISVAVTDINPSTTVTTTLTNGSTVLANGSNGLTYNNASAGYYDLKLTHSYPNTWTAVACNVTITYPYDDADPTATISPNSNEIQTNPSFNVSWSAADNSGSEKSGLKTVQVSKKSGSDWQSFFSGSYNLKNIYETSGNTPCVITSSNAFTYKVSVTDHANRTYTKESTVYIDLDNPTITSRLPVNGTVTGKYNITVSASVGDSFSGLKSVKIFNNSSEKYSKSDFATHPDKTTSYNLSESIELVADANQIAIQVQDQAGRNTTDSFNVQCTPPVIINPSVSPSTITTLGNECIFNYRININGYVRVTIADSYGDEYGEIQSWQYLAKNDDSGDVYGTNFNGSVHVNFESENIVKLLDNGTCYLKAQLSSDPYSSDPDYYKDSSTNKLYWLSALTINIPRNNVNATAKTISHGGTSITIPDVDFRFIKEQNPLPGIVILEDVNNPGNYQIPSGTYTAVAKKKGYKDQTNSSVSITNPNQYIFENFEPYIPSESGYDKSVNSDTDGIPDGWEYYYWINTADWSPSQDGFRLDVADGGCDNDRLYTLAGRRENRGDGLTNLQEYQLQQNGFATIDPRYTDLCVELDWVTYYAQDYAPDTIALQTCSSVFENAGVKIHFGTGSQSSAILNLDQSLIESPSISITTLNQILTNNQGTYSYSKQPNDIDIVHVIFAPGWTEIEGMPGQTQSVSAGGLYLPGGPGVYVFDLHTRNLSGQIIKNSINSQILSKYEGNILAHELGHVLGRPDKGE